MNEPHIIERRLDYVPTEGLAAPDLLELKMYLWQYLGSVPFFSSVALRRNCGRRKLAIPSSKLKNSNNIDLADQLGEKTWRTDGD